MTGISVASVSHAFITDTVTTALRNVSFEVNTGELVSIVGPSGCGKSTLLNMMAGLLKPQAGDITHGEKLVPMPNTRAGYVTQQDTLLPWKRVNDNVSVALELRKVPRAQRRERTRKALEMVGLADAARRFPSQLSGGMRRRVALARVLVYEPELILMDEPFSALDAQLRLVLQQELVDLRERYQPTIVFITHDVEEAALISDRVIVMRGRPGTVAKVVDLPFGRHRKLAELRYEPEFREAAEDLWHTLKGTTSQ